MLASLEPKQLLHKLPFAQTFALLSWILATAAFSQVDDSALPEPAKPGGGALKTCEFIYAVDERPTPSCHASTIVETPSGLTVATPFVMPV